MLRYVLAAGVGAALVYFLDPLKGAQRRESAVKQLSNMAQRGVSQLDDMARHTASTAQELSDRTARLEIDKAESENGLAAGNFPYPAHLHDTQP